MSDFLGSPQADLAELYPSLYTVFVKRGSQLYTCIFETHFIGDKMQNTAVKRFVKVDYNAKFQFHETNFQNQLSFTWYHQIERNMQC